MYRVGRFVNKEENVNTAHHLIWSGPATGCLILTQIIFLQLVHVLLERKD